MPGAVTEGLFHKADVGALGWPATVEPGSVGGKGAGSPIRSERHPGSPSRVSLASSGRAGCCGAHPTQVKPYARVGDESMQFHETDANAERAVAGGQACPRGPLHFRLPSAQSCPSAGRQVMKPTVIGLVVPWVMTITDVHGIRSRSRLERHAAT